MADSPLHPLPPEFDFTFGVDFEYGTGSASRVFAAVQDFIRACDAFDKHLITVVAPHITPMLLLGNIEAGSLRAKLRYALRSLDDDALRNLDLRRLLGTFLVDAKYFLLKWTAEERPQRLSVLREELVYIADQTLIDISLLQSRGEAMQEDFQSRPARPLPPEHLIQAIRGFQRVTSHLTQGDQAYMITHTGTRHDMNLSASFSAQELKALLVRNTKIVPMPYATLIVRKPDYLGKSRWLVRHDDRDIAVKIEDREWLTRFQSQAVTVQPRDALVCTMRVEEEYDMDGLLVRERFIVEHVNTIIRQADLT